uniref:Uncharacterized protein n=1 Tax=Chromera velia CCMP2878 TaxID=1169474 RepID=A0A0G4FGR1_9ALVE|eukprot:Cvel_16896.t1-p1 / transcript=Cvel_16896.t1 / gene=Cvel_16896 / organism=Chromera_velia_CCMP2878 / gene_product=hypothetical protein / transcript_product=hypothetical protein / location=Cvel_scaffold1322:42285-43015(+) / protein_length=133 / sequence_SO=supercontig / SO=protein_coding / is_pseudo=false
MRSMRGVPTSDVLCPAGSGHRATIPRKGDQKEDQGWIDREVYIRTPISEVLRNVPHIPLLRVRTEKLQDNSTRKFKTRTVINSKQVPWEGLSVATRLCPPEAVRIVLQIALNACKCQSVDLSLQKADVVQAYL